MSRFYFQHVMRFLGVLFFVFLFIVMVCPAYAEGVDTIITTGGSSSPPPSPAIFGTKIVWDDQTTIPSNIFMYDITTGNITHLVGNPFAQNNPSIAGNLIVWQDARNDPSLDIYLHNLSDGITQPITTHHNAQNPAMSGDKIVWQDKRSGHWAIYMYNITQGKEYLLTPDTPASDHELPAISGDRVVWEDYRNDPTDTNPAVFMNDTSTWSTSQISSDTTGTIFQGAPSISGKNVVWEDGTNIPFSSVMMSQIGGTEQQLSDGNSISPFYGRMDPSIDGNWVVWVDYENDPTNGQIYLNETNISPYTPIQIATSLYSNPLVNPKISGNRIVWEEQNSANNYQLHLFTIGASGTCPPVTFTENATSGGVPLTVSFNDTTTPEYAPAHWFWNFGDGTVSYAQNSTHQYVAKGQYLVNLTVSDAYCRNLSASQVIAVDAPPVAQFTGTPTSGLVPLNVQFTDASTGASPLSWNWSFGDISWFNTTVSSQKSPLHHYANHGTYSVQLFVTNPYGTGSMTRSGYIMVLQGVQELSTTPVTGISVDSRYGGQYLTYNITNAGNPVLNPAHSVLVSSPPLANGWQNITFVAADALGFADTGGNYTGNISCVYMQIENIATSGFSPSLNATVFVGYLMDLPTYPDPASLNAEIWESALAADNTSLSSIALQSGFTYVDAVAYTAEFTRTNIAATGNATINMSVNSSWDAGTGTTYITAIGISPSTGNTVGAILPTHYVGNDGTLDYFTATVPAQYAYLSKFILAKYSGSGNLFQLITLTVSSQVQGNSGITSESSTGAGPAVVTPAVVQTTVAPQVTEAPPPPDPGKTASLYINTNGVITQATTLTSTDNRATLTIGQGVVAKNRDGSILPAITIKAVPAASVPDLPQGSTISFAGIAYDLGPDGATFSPGISLAISYPEARWNQEYTFKAHDPITKTWVDLPTVYSPETGTISTSITHFCCFGLFSETKTQPSALNNPAGSQLTPVPASAPPAPPTNAINIFFDMIVWIFGLALKNLIILGIAVILVLGYYFMRRKKRMDRIRYML